MKFVHEIPSIEEFNGLDENVIMEDEFSSVDNDLVRYLLSLYFSLYEEVMFFNYPYFLSDSFDEWCRVNRKRLVKEWSVLMDDFIEERCKYFNKKYNVSEDISVLDEVDVSSLINTGVNTVIDTLKTDIIDKATSYQTVKKFPANFSVHSNFRRGLKRLSTQVDYKTQLVDKMIKRDYLDHVYGDELFYWVCSGRRTCAWCYMVEAESPQPLEYFPLDHPYGECELVPESSLKKEMGRNI